MAETALFALSAIAPETAAAGGLLSGGGLAAGSIGATIGSGLSLVSGLSTGLSAIGAIAGGQQQSAIAKINAKQSELQARTERLRGAQQVSSIRQNLRSTLATQNALFAGRGVALADGSPASVASASSNAASRDIQTAQFGTEMQADSYDLQGQQYAAEEDSAESGGLVDAFSILNKNKNSIRRAGKALGSLVE